MYVCKNFHFWPIGILEKFWKKKELNICSYLFTHLYYLPLWLTIRRKYIYGFYKTWKRLANIFLLKRTNLPSVFSFSFMYLYLSHVHTYLYTSYAHIYIHHTHTSICVIHTHLYASYTYIYTRTYILVYAM